MSGRVLLGTPAQGSRILGIPLRRASAGSAVIVGILASWMSAGAIGLALALILAAAGGLLLLFLRRSEIYPEARLRLAARRHRGGFAHDGEHLIATGTGRAVLAFQLGLATPRLFGRIGGDESADWVRLVTVASQLAAGFPGGARVVLSTTAIPSMLRSPSTPSSVPTYEVVSRVTVSPRSRLGDLERRRLATCAEQLSALSSELSTVRLARLEGEPALLSSSMGILLSSPGPQVGEREDFLELGGSMAAVMVARGWGEVSPPAGLLAPLFIPAPPARLVAVVLDPLPARRALRTVGRHRAEQEADSRLLRRHGYLERLEESARASAAVQQEERLLAGYSLARFQLVVAVLSPNRASLRRGVREMRELGSRCGLELAVALGFQREWFELAVAGVEGWS